MKKWNQVLSAQSVQSQMLIARSTSCMTPPLAWVSFVSLSWIPRFRSHWKVTREPPRNAIEVEEEVKIKPMMPKIARYSVARYCKFSQKQESKNTLWNKQVEFQIRNIREINIAMRCWSFISDHHNFLRALRVIMKWSWWNENVKSRTNEIEKEIRLVITATSSSSFTRPARFHYLLELLDDFGGDAIPE